MKLYRKPDGEWFGRRADAGRDAEIVEVQTDAQSLAKWANELSQSSPDGDYETVVERSADPVSYTQLKEGGDIEWFAGLTIEHQLTLTTLAHDNALKEISRLKSGSKGGVMPEIEDNVRVVSEILNEDAQATPEEEIDPFS